MVRVLFLAHSHWRYLVIAVGAVALLRFLYGAFVGSRWKPADRGLLLATVVAVDVQAALGASLWVAEQRWLGFEPVRSWEHPFVMLAVVVLAHLASARAKRSVAEERFRRVVPLLLGGAVVLALGVARVTL